jgi:hypothetical protein
MNNMMNAPRPLSLSRLALGLAPLAMLAVLAAGCKSSDADQLAAYQAEELATQTHLEVFDTLDFDVFSGQKWDRLHESHGPDVIVHWPDGHQTQGIDRHISDLKWLFTHAPDTRIKVHPVRFGSGEWTGVSGVMEGTFTQPMTTADGKTIQPTGKAFKLPMATLGHWKDGIMDEEFLFWDNQTYYAQMGVAF